MAEGGGCRDERRGSSASEVGTDDGTAKKEKDLSLYEYDVTFDRTPFGIAGQENDKK